MGLSERIGAIQHSMDFISKARFDENVDRVCISMTENNFDLQPTRESGGNTNGTLDPEYTSWLKKHPSALGMFEQIMASGKGKKIIVFLDYDGTLSPIVDDPDRAFMSEMMRAAVREVAKYFPTAIISGRSREKVFKFVQLAGVYYAGSHGMDIMAPVLPLSTSDVKHQTRIDDKQGSGDVLFQPAKEFLPTIQEIIEELEEKTKCIHGVIIENNRFCISVHFRRVREEDYSELEELVKSIVKDYPQFHLTRGRKVIEIRPSIKWDKGYALEYMLDTLGYGNSNDVLAFYIGDDRTDEDAFRVLQAKKRGYPIIVSSIPKETSAVYSLQDPSEVMSFLLHLARWRRNSSSSKIVI
ncbi:hypothetical protein Sjap_005311 [Stephania japonica]|uniref:Trehalose 6-phosphate phosphatase n=1 Tax=Stephania japonica TaxID=461633 RepID=A0AAP0K3T3_9MAGN